MRKLILALALLFAPSLAYGQCNGVFPANTLCGNLSGSPAPPSAFSASGTIVGPGSSVVNNFAEWANTSGTQLKDAGFTTGTSGHAIPFLDGTNVWTSTQTFNGTLAGTAFASPPAIGGTAPSTGVFINIDSNVLNSQVANYTVATTDCSKTIQLGTGSTGFFSLTFPSVSGFPATCSLKVIDSDTARGKRIIGLTGISKLYPAQTFGAKIVNGAWALFDKPPRFLVSGSLTIFFDKDRGTDTNDCLAVGTGACATSSQAMFDLQTNIDNEGTVTIQQGCTATPCTYTDLPFQSTGYVGAGSVVLQGDIITPANYTWTCAVTCAGGAVINFNPGTNGVWTVQGFTITSSLSTGAGIQIAYPAAARILHQKNNFGAFTSGEAFSCIGAATINDVTGGNYTISGGGVSFANIQDGCIAHFDKAVGTITGTPAFGTAFLIAHGSGAIIGTDNTHFSGAATGVKCNANLIGLVDAAGTAASLPGNSACTTATGGVVN